VSLSPASSLEEFDLRVFPTHYVAGTVELLDLNVTYNNIIGERVSQTNQILPNKESDG